MTLTNNYNLPDSIVRALSHDDYDSGGADISVTGLISPPRLRQLAIRHREETVEDVSELAWMLLGKAAHSIAEIAAGPDCIVEQRLMTEVNGWTLSGQIDLLEPNADGYSLRDFKCSSSWSAVFDKIEWVRQLNIYAELARRNGYAITDLAIVLICRDWDRRRAEGNSDYPQSPVVLLPIELYSQDRVSDWITERVAVHQMAEDLADDELPECTLKERWAEPEKWAVYSKKRNKRATKLFDDEDQAYDFADQIDAEKVEHRPGDKFKRCRSYCSVKEFCSQFQAGRD